MVDPFTPNKTIGDDFLIQIPGDSHCFYYSLYMGILAHNCISDQEQEIDFHYNSIYEMRANILFNAIQTYTSESGPGIEALPETLKEKLPKNLDLVSLEWVKENLEDEWADDAMISAAALIFNVQFEIQQKNRNPITIKNENENTESDVPTIRLYRTGERESNRHYELILQKNAFNKVQDSQKFQAMKIEQECYTLAKELADAQKNLSLYENEDQNDDDYNPQEHAERLKTQKDTIQTLKKELRKKKNQLSKFNNSHFPSRKTDILGTIFASFEKEGNEGYSLISSETDSSCKIKNTTVENGEDIIEFKTNEKQEIVVTATKPTGQDFKMMLNRLKMAAQPNPNTFEIVWDKLEEKDYLSFLQAADSLNLSYKESSSPKLTLDGTLQKKILDYIQELHKNPATKDTASELNTLMDKVAGIQEALNNERRNTL